MNDKYLPQGQIEDVHAEEVSRMLSLLKRFKEEEPVEEEVELLISGPPHELERLPIHPAAGAFLDCMLKGGWVIYDWDYSPWYNRIADRFLDPDFIQSLDDVGIRCWLTVYSRMLRHGSPHYEYSISEDAKSGAIPALLGRLAVLTEARDSR